ncbi:MAG: aminotransferase [Candidatus Cloacimonetes bacterium 4572_65]|nr:MAG: aminotransferase [Candidatus Cloacimonetes bacterium 4572_65]
MIKDLNSILSTNVKKMKRSAIRELLKLVNNPNIISFAGGLPSPDSFPVEELKVISNEVLTNEGTKVLQYGATEGDPLLRELLVKRYVKEGLDIKLDNLVITTASQQALDLMAKIFISPGDKVIVGLPSYLGGLSAFNSYGADMVGIPLDEDGMSSEKLAEKLAQLDKENDLPKFIYVIPDFQNPAGITMPDYRRIEIIELAKKYDILIIEDSPYRELRFEGEPQKTMYQLDGTEQVILLGTFSKIFAPGFRIGWVIGNEQVIDKLVVAKQATDLCTPPFTQRIAARYMEKGLLDVNIVKINELYTQKKKIMMDALEEFMPEGITWTKSEGGLFTFLTLPESINTSDLIKVAIEKENVAFVAGTSFYCDGTGTNTLRLNFSYATAENNLEGIKRLARVIKQELNK